MGEDKFRITVLGARGSIPVSGKKYDEYGGNTSCYMVEAGDCVIFLDAGTGIINAPEIDGSKNIDILISHSHLDHIIGLPFFPELSKEKRPIRLYGKRYNGVSIESQIESAFLEPYWPITISEYPSDIQYEDLNLPLELYSGDEKIFIEGISVKHPGGCLAFSITYKGKKLVYASDCEMYPSPGKDIIDFSEGANLLLCDAQYTEKEYEKRKGFGHSTVKTAINLMESAKVDRMMLIHHDPLHDDKMMQEMENSLDKKNIFYAKSGMKIDLL